MRAPFRTVHYDDLQGLQRAAFAAKLTRAVRQENGCLEYPGTPLHSGHVQISHGPKSHQVRVRAHVFAWELANRRSVPAGQVVMHTCDHPRCVNPDHLRLGTQGDNIRDSIHKGRYNAFGRQKLNAQQVIEIRRLLAEDVNHAVIAARYGVTRGAITSIACGYSWRHVPRHVPPVTYNEGKR